MKSFKDKVLAFLVVMNIGMVTMAAAPTIKEFIEDLRAPEAEPMMTSNTFSYQGRLTNPAGDPLESGGYYMEFWFYNTQDENNVTAICHGIGSDVVVKNGNFSVVLDANASADGDCNFIEMMSQNADVWMQLKVRAQGSDTLETLKPRINVGAVPRAHHSQVAEVAKSSLDGSPVGTISAFYGNTAPDGWLVADGSSITWDETHPEYRQLIDHLRNISSSHQVGSNGALLPDLRGVFIRGKNFSRNIEEGNEDGDLAIGAYQSDAFEYHGHEFRVFSVTPNTGCNHALAEGHEDCGGTNFHQGLNWDQVLPNGDDETRPRNVTVLYIIKY